MADPKINIRVNAATAEAERNLGRLEGKVKDAGAAGAKSGGLMEGFSKAISAVAGVSAGATVVLGTFKKAFDFAKAGSGLIRTKDQLDNLAVSIGTTSDAITDRLSKAMGGLMTDAEIVSGATDIISLGLADTEDDVVRLATLVGKLGWDMQTVILTFANNSKMRLDSLGLSVEDVEEKMARLEEQGYSTDKAFDMAVIEAGEEKLRLLGDSADAADAAFIRFEKRIEDITDKAKIWLAEGLTPWLELMEGGSLNVNDALEKHEEQLGSTAKTYDEYSEEMIRSYEVAGKLVEQWLELEYTYEEQAVALGMMTKEQFIATKAMEDMPDILKVMSRGMEDVKEATDLTTRSMRTEADALDGVVISANALYYENMRLEDSINSLSGEMARALDTGDSFEQILFDQSVTAGVDALSLGALAMATGEYTFEQIEAALAAAAFEIRAKELAEAMAANEITAHGALVELRKFREELDNLPMEKRINIIMNTVGQGYAPETQYFDPDMPEYQHGAWEIPRTQIAQIHKGEMVLPPSLADAVRQSVTNNNYNLAIHTSAPAESALSDFNVMKALSGV